MSKVLFSERKIVLKNSVMSNNLILLLIKSVLFDLVITYYNILDASKLNTNDVLFLRKDKLFSKYFEFSAHFISILKFLPRIRYLQTLIENTSIPLRFPDACEISSK